MSSRRKTHFSILGLLTWKPMSGYDIKKIVDVGLSHFWNENYGQIYPTLDQLVSEGFATKKAERRCGKRQRFVYTITRRGRKAIRDWLNAPSEAPVVRNELLLKVFLSSSLPTKVSIDLIDQHRRQQQALLDEYRYSEELLCRAIGQGTHADELSEILAITAAPSVPSDRQLTTFYLTLRHGIRVVEARLAWCEEATACLSGARATSVGQQKTK